MSPDNSPKNSAKSRKKKFQRPPDHFQNIRFVSVDHGKAAEGYGRTTTRQQEPNPGLSAPGPGADYSQLSAAALMASHELDFDSREHPANRWKTQWSQLSTSVKGPGQKRRVLLQCLCGYDHTARGYRSRTAARPFTGCLAHAEVTYLVETQQILRVRGYFKHNEQCGASLLSHIPRQPLHPSVFEVALSQLVTGVPLTQIQKRNRDLINSRGYPGMDDDSKHVKCRWLFQRSDTRSLYRQFSRLNGVKMEQKPHINIDDWLNPDSASYNKEFAEAVFHYHARASKGERFEVSVATKEMHEASWKYGHHKQILLDGTFGLCDKKLLLFIVMGIDDEGHGVPLSFMFFSAPSENRHTAAGYDTDVLEKLIEKWKVSVEKFGGDRKFCPWVAGTDTDLKERAALIHVFPDILLLICRAHLRRSWRNHRNKSLKGKAPGLKEMRSRIKAVEDELVKSTTFLAAQTIVAEAKEFVTQNQPDLLEAAYSGALVHLEYLSSYWLTKNLWASWSDYGRYAAAKKLGCTFDQVASTTNHLESFNNVLKHKYIQQQQHGGRRLRVDVLLHYLITDMLPSIFEQRRMERGEKERRRAWILSLPGGNALWQQQQTGKTVFGPVAYLVADAERDRAARDLLEFRQIGSPSFSDDGTLFTFSCYSSHATVLNENPLIYAIRIHLNGLASCTCPDFQHRGGACKHIRAALLYLDHLRVTMAIPNISLPDSYDNARSLVAGIRFSPTEPSELSPVQRSAKVLDDMLGGTALNGIMIKISRPGKAPTISPPIPEAASLDNDGDSDDSDDGLSSLPDDAEEFEFTIPKHSAKVAINDQALARVSSELNVAAPKMAELGRYLQGAQLNPDHLGNFKSYYSDIMTLASQLHRMIDETGSIAPQLMQPAPTPNFQRPPKRPNEEILAPSPEKKNKRNDSFAIH
ncbi:hypothetical protein C8J56DRAFT_1114156 [Mycena floridula]|nr:hypothetical protein C8J56DRAFT_1114156 [Mycena floridula]